MNSLFMSEIRINLPPTQETIQHTSAKIDSAPRPIDHTQHGQSQPEQSKENLDLTRAKLGVEKFKQIYETGDEIWKKFLTETDPGEELQAMYLGLKPIIFVQKSLDRERVQALLEEHAEGNYSLYKASSSDMLYDSDQVKKVLMTYPEYFPDYTPNTSIQEYLATHATGGTKDDPQKKIQVGL